MKKVRNVVARLAIMRKGGVHDKSNKAKRQKHKQKLAKQIRAKDFGPFLFLDSLFHSFIPISPQQQSSRTASQMRGSIIVFTNPECCQIMVIKTHIPTIFTLIGGTCFAIKILKTKLMS